MFIASKQRVTIYSYLVFNDANFRISPPVHQRSQAAICDAESLPQSNPATVQPVQHCHCSHWFSLFYKITAYLRAGPGLRLRQPGACTAFVYLKAECFFCTNKGILAGRSRSMRTLDQCVPLPRKSMHPLFWKSFDPVLEAF